MILSFISITIFTNKKPRTAVQHTLFGANISIRGTTQIRFVLTQQTLTISNKIRPITQPYVRPYEIIRPATPGLAIHTRFSAASHQPAAL